MQLNEETNELTPTTGGNFIHRIGSDHDYYSRITLAPSEVVGYEEHFHEVTPEWRAEHEPKPEPEPEEETK
jgi:hypothetical protein